MIYIVWPKSRLVIRVTGRDDRIAELAGDESHWYPDQYPNPVRDQYELGSVAEAADASALGNVELKELSAEEAFVALSGLGFPEERDCRPCAVRQQFASAVRRIEAEPLPGTNRTLIRSIVFDEGSELFLGAAPEGAIAYRLSKHHRAVDLPAPTRSNEGDVKHD